MLVQRQKESQDLCLGCWVKSPFSSPGQFSVWIGKHFLSKIGAKSDHEDDPTKAERITVTDSSLQDLPTLNETVVKSHSSGLGI